MGLRQFGMGRKSHAKRSIVMRAHRLRFVTDKNVARRLSMARENLFVRNSVII
jgi:hypothetical protein